MAEKESKKRRVEEEDDGEGYDRDQQRRLAKAQFMTSTLDEQALRNLIIRICTQLPEAAEMVEEQVQDDVVMRKLFIRGLSNEATKEHVQEFFERFGNVEDVTIVMDRSTGRSKGYGFVTFQTMEGAFNSLQEPEKDFDGRRLFCNLAAVRDSKQSSSSGGASSGPQGAPSSAGDDDVEHRKLFVRGLAYDVTADRLRSLFEEYGEIEDCSVITDKATGRSKGYGFVTYKTSAGAAAAVERGQKEVDGRTVYIHYASSRSKDSSDSQQQHPPHGGMYPPMAMRQGMGFPGYNPAMAAQYYHMMAAAPYRMWG